MSPTLIAVSVRQNAGFPGMRATRPPVTTTMFVVYVIDPPPV
jgi:hypothetical protein